MKIVCSVASCKYSSENEDSSSITFISFPNNDTASVWAHNCGRPDLIAKPTEDLHTNHYICSDHIEDEFFISKTNPIIIAQNAVPTVFRTSRNLENTTLLSMKEKNRPKNVIDCLELAEFINVVDVCQTQNLSEEAQNSTYRESEYDKEQDTTNYINFCDTTINIEQLQGITNIRLTNLCRICGQYNADGIDILTDKGLKMGLREKIFLHTSISVKLEDTMPHKICSDCCEKLESTHSLVATCLQTDIRLRKLLNISGKAEYDPKFEGLVTSCSMEVANEISLNNVKHNAELSNNCNKIDKTTLENKFNCKWKEIPANIELEQVSICPISEPITDNATNLKYVIHSDLKNLFHALNGISPKNDERNNETSSAISLPASNDENLRLICLNCNVLFETEEIFNSHEIICNSDNLQTNEKENDANKSKWLCPVCRNSFDDEEIFKQHKETCHESWMQYSCRNCNQLFVNKDDLDIHELLHEKKKIFVVPNRRCGHCSVVFNTRKELQLHITNIHDDQPLFKCSICDKTYGKWSSLDIHEATHRLDKPYLCDLCGKSFKHSNNLRGHKRIHLEESKKKRHVCDICGSAFRSRFHLKEHTNQHDGYKPYTCEDCGKAFHKRIQLRQHRLSHGSNKYACPICGVTFNRLGNMKTHLKRHSKSEGIYTCSVCKYKCNSMSELKMHRKQHSDKDIMESIKLKTTDKTVWQCKTCDKIFPKRAILLNHEVMHSVDRARFECDKCGKKLANKNSLKYHNKSIHSTERPYVCQFCSDAFVSKEARIIHERIHTGERPYTCKICSMKYRCSSNLSQHMKIHSSIRPYVCHYCDKTFIRKGALNVHERIHTGLKPFVCQICSRSFSQKNDMLKHTKTHESKSMQCDKCDMVFDNKNEILKHLDFHEQNAIQDSIIPEYVEVAERLKCYTLNIQCSSIEETD